MRIGVLCVHLYTHTHTHSKIQQEELISNSYQMIKSLFGKCFSNQKRVVS